MSRVLVCGSRLRYWTDPAAGIAKVTEVIDALPDDTIVIVGDSTGGGVDRWARDIATRRGLFVAGVSVGPQHYRRHGKRAPLLRDHAMLDLLQPATDRVVAVQCADSPGTGYTVAAAHRRGLPVEHYRFESAQLEVGS
jgi:hypothetical protein